MALEFPSQIVLQKDVRFGHQPPGHASPSGILRRKRVSSIAVLRFPLQQMRAVGHQGEGVPVTTRLGSSQHCLTLEDLQGYSAWGLEVRADPAQAKPQGV